MTDHARDEQPAATTTTTSPIPHVVTDDPRWRLIWAKLLGPTADEIAAAKRDAAEGERVA